MAMTPRRQRLLDELEDIHVSMESSIVKAQLRQLLERPLTPQQLRLLGLLVVDGPRRPSELAKAMDISAAAASGLLERMAAADLIAFGPVPGDARGRLVRPTESGTQALRDILTARARVLDWITDDVTEDELAGLVLGLRGLMRANIVEEDSQEPSQAAGPPASDGGDHAEGEQAGDG
ncbi:MAG: MarR family transcriptional regulator [Propionibacteriaceae bacterium]|nr:MarR family transcriptional regulator [Propionibacteriaceae bacterium]